MNSTLERRMGQVEDEAARRLEEQRAATLAYIKQQITDPDDRRALGQLFRALVKGEDLSDHYRGREVLTRLRASTADSRWIELFPPGDVRTLDAVLEAEEPVDLGS